VLDAGTLSFTLAPVIEAAERLIVLDAAQLNRAPGSLQCFRDARLDEFLGRPRLSVHEIGLRDLMDLARLAGALPLERVLIGIQPESLDWGMELTPAVAAGIESMIAMAAQLLDSWTAYGPSATQAIVPQIADPLLQRTTP
jgi:hydrogenase maturation protease